MGFVLLLGYLQAQPPAESVAGFELRQTPVAWTERYHLPAWQVVAFSADGKLVATADLGTIRVWSVGDGSEKTRIHLPEVRWRTHLAFTADGKSLVAAGDTAPAIRWFDLSTGKQTKERPLPKPQTLGSMMYQSVVRLGPGGEWHLGYDLLGDDIKAVVWDTATGDRRAVLDEHPQYILQEALPLGDRPEFADMAYSPVKSIRVWSVATGRVVRRLDRPAHGRRRSNPRPLAASPDGRLVALSVSGSDGQRPGRSRTEVWRTFDSCPIAALPGEASSAAFSADSRALITVVNGKVQLYDMAKEAYDPNYLITGPAQYQVASRNGKALAVTSWPNGDGPGGLLLVGPFPKLADPLPATGDLTGDRLTETLHMLASANEIRGRYAVKALVARPEQAVAVLGERVNPDPARRRAAVADLVTILDDDNPDTRDKASGELLPLAHRFEAFVTASHGVAKPGEVRNRLAAILATVQDNPAPPDLNTDLRAVEVLEAVDTAPAKALLAKLAGGADGSRLTLAAKAAVERLGKR